MPERIYKCQLCSGWHLTSIGVQDQPPHAFLRGTKRKVKESADKLGPMTKPFEELRDEFVTSPERARAVELEKRRILDAMDRYERDPKFRERIDYLIDNEHSGRASH